MIVLTKEQVLMLHAQLITETGGSPGLRDEALLESALYAPFQSFETHEIYPSIPQKVAPLESVLHKIMLFIDGNKRIGAHAMLVFLALNQIELSYTQSELSDIFLAIAAGTYSFADLVQWILKHRI